MSNIFTTAKVRVKAKFNKNLYKEMNEEIYEEYLVSKSSKNLDTVNTTYKTYKSNMELFLNWFHCEDKGYYLLDTKMLDEFPEILDRYMLYCLTVRKNNKVTVNNKITALSSFYIWARRMRKALFNPVLDIERQRKAKQDKRRNSYFLTVDQIRYCKQYMEAHPQKYDLRSQLMFSIFLDSAIRIGELIRLKLSNLDLKNNCFRKIKQKGGEVREVIFTQETKELLIQYLEWRKSKNIATDDLLITRYNGTYKPMSRETIRARIKEIGKILGIQDLYPHTLRKTIVNIMTKLGGIEKGALIAHHKSTTVTKDHYVEPLTELEIREQLMELNALVTKQTNKREVVNYV